MKCTKTTLLVALLAATATVSVNAQRDNRHMEKDVVTLLNDGSADQSHVESTLKTNAPQTPNDNGLPRFAIVGKNRQFYLGIGAQFLGEGVVDWGDDMPSAINFTPSSITPSTAGNKSNLSFAWQTSSIYLNFVAMPGTDNKIGIFFKGKFRPDKTFKCSHFYAKYRGLTAGYTNSLFTDGAAMPMTIDNEGPNGAVDLSLFTAYWTQDFSKNISGAIGIDDPQYSATPGALTAMVNQRIPSIPVYLQYAWDGGNSHLRLSGILRPMQYRDLKEAENEVSFGGGIQLSGVTNIVGGLSASFSGAYGKAIGNYLQDDNGLGLDAVATTEPGKMAAVESMGLTGGLTYKFSPKVMSNVVYSHLTNWLPDKALTDGSQYRYGDYVAVNVIYNINKIISAGVEYDYGYRKSFDGTGLAANRMQCQLAVTF